MRKSYVPKISVVMAIYNGEKYLRQSMDSVLQQDFRDFEFIIVDDGSTDTTPVIIASYGDDRIVYVKNKKNIGQTASLNIGLNVAKGKYIARIDADDIYLQGKLGKQFVFMEEHPDVTVCGTAGIRIDENGQVLSEFNPLTDMLDINFSIFYRTPVVHVSVMMVRSVILENGGYDENYLYCADFALWSKLIRNKCVITNINKKLTAFRLYSGSLGAVQKLSASGREMTDIIYENITQMLKIPISREQCQDIVFMLFPESDISTVSICRAYLLLINLSRYIYGRRIPMRIHKRLYGQLFWSLVKKGLYLRSQKGPRSVFYDITSLFDQFLGNPTVISIAIVSYCLAAIGEINAYRIKKMFNHMA